RQLTTEFMLTTSAGIASGSTTFARASSSPRARAAGSWRRAGASSIASSRARSREETVIGGRLLMVGSKKTTGGTSDAPPKDQQIVRATIARRVAGFKPWRGAGAGRQWLARAAVRAGWAAAPGAR